MSAGPVNVPLRRAALALHALSEDDRDWMMASLGAAARSSLQPLLAELEELGIPRESAFADEVVARPMPDVPARWPDRLDGRGLTAVARVLAREPAELTAALLSMKNWSWAPRLLAELQPDRRSELEALGSVPRPGPHRQEAILAALESHVAQEPEFPRPAASGTWRGLLHRIGRWR